MSEARKKMIEEMRESSRKYTERLVRDTPLSGMANIEEIQRKEQEVKEKIKRKKEELRLKREVQLAKIRRELDTARLDERSSIQLYEKLNNMFKEVPSTANLDLRQIIEEEKKHLERLEWIFRNLPKH